MDRNPERMTFDPFVLPYETPLDICFPLSFLQCLRHTRGIAGLFAGTLRRASAVYPFLYIHICTWLLWLGERKLSFVPLHHHLDMSLQHVSPTYYISQP
jgi:hypothetical protein